MAATVAAILGISPDSVIQETYVGVDKKMDTQALSVSAAGHMVFDYDPKGGPGSMRRAPLAAWRDIWQREQILADQWDSAFAVPALANAPGT